MALITGPAREELIALFVGMFKAPPGSTNLSAMVAAYESGATIGQIAATLALRAEFNTVYPSLWTPEEFADALADHLLPASTPAASRDWAVNWVVGALTAGASRSDIIATAVLTLRGPVAPAYADAKAQLENKTDVAEYYSVDKLQNGTLAEMQAVIDGVTNDDSTVTTAETEIDTGIAVEIGQTFVVTAGIDALNGTTGNDVFNAAGAAGLLGAFDTISGGLGDDTLNVTALGVFATSASTKVTSVETVNISGDDTITADVSAWTGLKSLNVGAAVGAVMLTTKGNATSVSVGGADVTTVDIMDSATVDVLTSVSISGNTDVVVVDSTALTSLTLASTDQDADLSTTSALAVNYNGVTGGALTADTATTLTVNAVSSATSAVTLNAAAATKVTLDADVALSIADVNIAAATSIVVKGDSKVTLAAVSTITALTAIDGSASSGGVDIDAFTLANGITFTGGSGADAVVLAASTKATVLGAGDDLVTLTGAALGTLGTVDAGAGTGDTLSMTATNAATATGSAVFEGTISGFEKVVLTTATNNTINLANLDDVSYVSTAGSNGLTLNGIASGGTLELTDTNTATTVGVLNAGLSTSTSDVFNIKATNAASKNVGTITVADVETININSDDTAAAPAGAVQHTAVLTAAAATSLVVSGDAGLVLTLTGSAALANINTSGVTKGAVSVTTWADLTATFVGGATATTISMASLGATKVATITTGAGNDVITGGAGADTIVTGDGANSVVAGAGADTITGGAGVDTITGGAGADKITGGAGADIYTYTAATESNGVNQDTITGFVTASDKLAINTTGTGAGAVYLGEANGYGAVLTALSGLGTANGGEAVLDITTGTLYIDINVDGVLDANDMAIQLTGVVDLATADFTFS